MYYVLMSWRRGSCWILTSESVKNESNMLKKTLSKSPSMDYYILLDLSLHFNPLRSRTISGRPHSDLWKQLSYKKSKHIRLLRMSGNLTVLCGTVKPLVWMSEDIAMCEEGSSCYTWKAEWCEQVTQGFCCVQGFVNSSSTLGPNLSEP